MSELYDIDELIDGSFYLSFNLIYRYHREYPFPTEKLKCAKYQKGSFRGGLNTIGIVTYEDK